MPNTQHHVYTDNKRDSMRLVKDFKPFGPTTKGRKKGSKNSYNDPSTMVPPRMMKDRRAVIKIPLYELAELEAIVKNKDQGWKAVKPVEYTHHIFNDTSYEKIAYVYVYFDPRKRIEMYESAEGVMTNRDCVYIGKGTGLRFLHSMGKESATPAVEDLQNWIMQLRAEGLEPLVAIWAMGLDKIQSEYLEADLIRLFSKTQNSYTGIDTYKGFLRPRGLLNRRRETTREFNVYNDKGEILKK